MSIFNNKVFKIIFNIVKFLILLMVFLYIAFIFVQRISNNSSVGGYRVYTIATSSMEGVYNVNDVILVKDCDTSKLKVGDDIAYIGNKHDLKDKVISHRIIEIKKDEKTGDIKYVTKGIKNDIPDPAITPDQILGKIDGVVPVISPINHVIKSQAGFFLLVFCPLVIVIVLEILHVISEIGEDKQKIDRIGQTTIAMERIMEEEKREEEEDDKPPVIERVDDDEKDPEDEDEDDDEEDDSEEEQEEEQEDIEELEIHKEEEYIEVADIIETEEEKEKKEENEEEEKFVMSEDEGK